MTHGRAPRVRFHRTILGCAAASLALVAACGGGAPGSDAGRNADGAGRAADDGPLAGEDAAPRRTDAGPEQPRAADGGRIPDAGSGADLRPRPGDAGAAAPDGAVNLAPCRACGLGREGIRKMMVLRAGTGPQRAQLDADRTLCETDNPPFGTAFVRGSPSYRSVGFCYGGTTESFNRSFVSIDLDRSEGSPRFRGQAAVKAATFAFSRPYDNNPTSFFVDEAIVLVAVGAPGGTVAACKASAFESGTIDARTSACKLGRLTVSLDDLANPTKLRVEFTDGGREEVPLFDLTLP